LELDSFVELNFDKPYIFNFEAGRIKLKKLLMYEPESIYEINENNENKNYILAGYDKIPEEKEIQSKNENEYNEESLSRESKEENSSLDFIGKTNSSNNKNKNSINIKNNQKTKKPQQNFLPNKIVKNTFFDEAYNNNTKKDKINDNNNIQKGKNKKNIKNNIPPKNNQIKNKKINFRKPLKQEQKQDKNESISIFQNNILENEELYDNIEEKKEDDNANNTLTSNSLKENKSTGTGRNNNDNDNNNNNDYSFKNKTTSRKLTYRDSLAQNNMQLREINLRFILTKEEYAVLMKEKAKIKIF